MYTRICVPLEGVLFIAHIASPNDLYRITLDASGKPVREMMSEFTSMVVSYPDREISV